LDLMVNQLYSVYILKPCLPSVHITFNFFLLGVPSGLLPSVIPIKTSWAFLVSPVYVTFPAGIISFT
jgi:hypothetical protein